MATETVQVTLPRASAKALAILYRAFMEDPSKGILQTALTGALIAAFDGDARSLTGLEKAIDRV